MLLKDSDLIHLDGERSALSAPELLLLQLLSVSVIAGDASFFVGGGKFILTGFSARAQQLVRLGLVWVRPAPPSSKAWSTKEQKVEVPGGHQPSSTRPSRMSR